MRQVKQTQLTQLTSRLLGIAPGKRDMKTINASSRVIWLLVLTISGKILVNGKDYPIYYGKNETTNQSSVHLFFFDTLSIVKMHLISGRFRRLKLIIKSRETWLCRMIPPYPIGSMVLVYMLT